LAALWYAAGVRYTRVRSAIMDEGSAQKDRIMTRVKAALVASARTQAKSNARSAAAAQRAVAKRNRYSRLSKLREAREALEQEEAWRKEEKG